MRPVPPATLAAAAPTLLLETPADLPPTSAGAGDATGDPLVSAPACVLLTEGDIMADASGAPLKNSSERFLKSVR